MLSYTPTEAKKKFLSVCRSVMDEKKRVSIKTSSGKPAIVLDYKNRTGCTVFAKISAQSYKDNFSAYCRLSSYGVTFQLSLKGSNYPIFVRKYMSYSSSSGLILKKWSEDTAENAIKHEQHKIIGDLARLGLKIENQNETIESLKSIIKLGMERIAIGHHPSREGQIRIDYGDEI